MKDNLLRFGIAVYFMALKWASIAFIAHAMLHWLGIPHPGI